MKPNISSEKKATSTKQDTCVNCKSNVCNDSQVYCYKCGELHHESCFKNHRSCCTLKCPSTIYVHNHTGTVTDCRQSAQIIKNNGSQNFNGKRNSTSSSPSPADNPILQVICMLSAFLIFLIVTVMLAR